MIYWFLWLFNIYKEKLKVMNYMIVYVCIRHVTLTALVNRISWYLCIVLSNISSTVEVIKHIWLSNIRLWAFLIKVNQEKRSDAWNLECVYFIHFYLILKYRILEQSPELLFCLQLFFTRTCLFDFTNN